MMDAKSTYKRMYSRIRKTRRMVTVTLMSLPHIHQDELPYLEKARYSYYYSKSVMKASPNSDFYRVAKEQIIEAKG